MIKLIIFLFSVFYLVLTVCGSPQNAGPVGYVKTEYFSKCPNFNEKEEFKFDFQLKNTEDSKALYATAHIEQDINEDFEFRIKIDKWSNGVWQNDVYNADGNALEYINEYLPKIFEHMREQIVPKIKSDKVIPAGDYILKNFQDIEASINLPQILYGRFRITYIFIKDKIELACIEFGAESKPKN